MSIIAVIDTETTWGNEVMSIGVVVADSDNYSAVDKKYYILDPEYKLGGLFSHELMLVPGSDKCIVSREQAVSEIKDLFVKAGISGVFAYNAGFDKNHLPEISGYNWYDIMKIAAYKQYNKAIPDHSECCKTGRLKRNYGVEHMMRLLSGNGRYYETHNALNDAVDELEIMRLLNHSIETYENAVLL